MDKLDLVKGQVILLELEDECVIGEVLHIGGKKTFVRMKNVRDFQSNVPIAGNQDFYSSEIRNIKIIQDVEPGESESLEPRAESGLSSKATVESTTRINLEDIQETYDRIDNHVFIFQTDIKYHDAIKYLRTQRLIALGMEEVGAGRHSTAPSLLSIATPDRIYLFDVMWMNVPKDLRAILGDPKVRRVAHNARLVEDVLRHRFQAPLGKCFDTLVAHISTTNDYDDQREVSIQECLAKYLNLPSNFFDSNIRYNSRPLNETQRKAAAKNVAFLLVLQDYLLHEIMLEPFYRSCRHYGSSLAGDSEHLASVMKLSKGRNDDLNDIERFRLNIREKNDDNDDVND
ncbi:uncharacterized protein LOC134225554 [Armigeres subalbatus]|uniref:uncharacterized protein LOC134225554 n=1 Tax=Armigeres subalbatus TaxID=124917 RepID=UPI002ED65813